MSYKGISRAQAKPRARDRELTAPRAWLKKLGAQPGVAGVQGDAPAPSADLG